MDMPMPQPSNHGFNLLGRKSLVLSHIPMFMPPHQAQLFLEVELTSSGSQDPTDTYLHDQAQTKTTNYVLLADPLVLPTLAPDAPHRLTSFTGKLYRGWPFNNPNTAPLLVSELTVKVTRSIYYQSILQGHILTDLTYLAFASEKATYLVHKLVQPPELQNAPKPPDFCQILSAKISGVGSEQLRHVKDLRFPGVPNRAAHKLSAPVKAEGELGSKKARVSTVVELIFDPDHLTM